MTPISRRAALAGLAAVAPATAAGAIPAAAIGDDPDAELLALKKEFDRVTAIEDALWRDMESADDEAEYDVADVASAAAEIGRQMAAIPARTLAGLRAKAGTIGDAYQIEGIMYDPDGDDMYSVMMRSLFDDLTRDTLAA